MKSYSSNGYNGGSTLSVKIPKPQKGATTYLKKVFIILRKLTFIITHFLLLRQGLFGLQNMDKEVLSLVSKMNSSTK